MTFIKTRISLLCLAQEHQVIIYQVKPKVWRLLTRFRTPSRLAIEISSASSPALSAEKKAVEDHQHLFQNDDEEALP